MCRSSGGFRAPKRTGPAPPGKSKSAHREPCATSDRIPQRTRPTVRVVIAGMDRPQPQGRLPTRLHAKDDLVPKRLPADPSSVSCSSGEGAMSSRDARSPVDQLMDCPACGLPAEITDRFTLDGLPAPVEHVRLVCVAGHWFTPPSDSLTGTREPAPGSRPRPTLNLEERRRDVPSFRASRSESGRQRP